MDEGDAQDRIRGLGWLADVGVGMDLGYRLIWYGCANGWRKGEVSVNWSAPEAGVLSRQEQ